MLDNNEREVNVEVTLMHLIHDQVSVGLERVRVVDEAHQKDTGRHESDLGHSRSLLLLHSDLVADSLANAFLKLGCDTSRDVDSGKASWLCADDFHILLALQATLKDVLGHLGRFATASVS